MDPAMLKNGNLSADELEAYLDDLKANLLAGNPEQSSEKLASLADIEVGLDNCKSILAALNRMEKTVSNIPNCSYSMKNEMLRNIHQSRKVLRGMIKRNGIPKVETPQE